MSELSVNRKICMELGQNEENYSVSGERFLYYEFNFRFTLPNERLESRP